MNIKFHALEVGSGDAFLLECGDKRYLFDAGGSRTKIVNLLNSKRINKLDLVICSHNDIDHVNGVIGLLKSEIDIDEIWLPGTWASILQFVKDNIIGYRKLDILDDLCKTEGEPYIRGSINTDECYNGEKIEAENFNEELAFFSELHDDEMIYRYIYVFYRHLRHFSLYGKQLLPIFKLNRIMQIAALAYQKGCIIRWFEPKDGCTNNDIKYGFRALNSNKIASVKKIKNFQSFCYVLNLSPENKYSLVFEFLNEQKPIVRFSADSNASCQSENPYSQNIIVTAPHHGSDANACVYQNINGHDIIWVRSDRKSSKRPCKDFKSKSNKYCLACLSKNFKNEICFEYDNNLKKWNHQFGNKCNC